MVNDVGCLFGWLVNLGSNILLEFCGVIGCGIGNFEFFVSGGIVVRVIFVVGGSCVVWDFFCWSDWL